MSGIPVKAFVVLSMAMVVPASAIGQAQAVNGNIEATAPDSVTAELPGDKK